MNKRRVLLVFYALVVLASLVSLPRCGSKLGKTYDAKANGMKY